MSFVIDDVGFIAKVSRQGHKLIITVPINAYDMFPHGQRIIVKKFNYKTRKQEQ